MLLFSPGGMHVTFGAFYFTQGSEEQFTYKVLQSTFDQTADSILGHGVSEKRLSEPFPQQKRPPIFFANFRVLWKI